MSRWTPSYMQKHFFISFNIISNIIFFSRSYDLKCIQRNFLTESYDPTGIQWYLASLGHVIRQELNAILHQWVKRSDTYLVPCQITTVRDVVDELNVLGSNAIIFHKGLIYYTSESQHQQPNASAAEHGRVNENVVGLLHVDADCLSDQDSTNHSIRHMTGDNPCNPRVYMRFKKHT